jgi:hypothetical protein
MAAALPEFYSVEELTPKALERLMKTVGLFDSLDADGDVVVGSRRRASVARAHGRPLLQLWTILSAKSDASRPDRLALANRINDQLLMPKAAVDSHGRLVLSHHVYIGKGASADNLVASTRSFLSSLEDVTALDEGSVLL